MTRDQRTTAAHRLLRDPNIQPFLPSSSSSSNITSSSSSNFTSSSNLTSTSFTPLPSKSPGQTTKTKAKSTEVKKETHDLRPKPKGSIAIVKKKIIAKNKQNYKLRVKEEPREAIFVAEGVVETNQTKQVPAKTKAKVVASKSKVNMAIKIKKEYIEGQRAKGKSTYSKYMTRGNIKKEFG